MMDKTTFSIDDFLVNVEPGNEGFVKDIHTSSVKDGYKVKIEQKASGFFVSYSHPKTKRSLLNFMFRKKRLMVRIYADNLYRYDSILKGLPENMIDEIRTAHSCKRLIDPNDCSPTCKTGYDFYIGDEHYQKCRYSCFEFAVDEKSIPILSDFIENERMMRRSG